MYFDDLKKVLEIAQRTGCVVIVVPEKTKITIKNALVLEPTDKTTISIEQVRETLEKVTTKQLTHRFVVVRPAELLSEPAANAFLKNLEEPGEKVHFVLITSDAAMILPTILSRAMVFYYREPDMSGIEASAAVKNLAKRLMVAKSTELIPIAEEISKKKNGVRAYALEVVGVTILMFYKTYLLTGKDVYLKKLPRFLKLYDHLERNGHIKLHIVADLC